MAEVTPAPTVQRKVGDAARRLRRLQMTFDSKNFPRFFLSRVYSDHVEKLPAWEPMPPIDLAVHQKRFVDNGYLHIDDQSLQVMVTTLDKFAEQADGAAWELFVLHRDAIGRVRLNRRYQVLGIEPYDGLLGNIPQTRYDPLSITAAVENWLDGLYLPGYAKLVLQIIEQRDGYVTVEALQDLLQGWLAAIGQT